MTFPSDKNLWAAIRRRDEAINGFFKALDEEVKLHGDPNGSLQRLRQKLYNPEKPEPTSAFKVMADHFGMPTRS